MSESRTDECGAFEARLCAGETGADNPALAAHLRSCLPCFRTAADLREVPRIEALLRERPPTFDPGSGFWASFPGRVAGAWEASRRRAPVVSPALRLLRWLRLPVPAALAGAACAALAVHLATRVPTPPPTGPATTAASAAVYPGVTVIDQNGEIDEEFLRSLDVKGLKALLEDMHQEFAPGEGRDESEMETDLATMTEELDMLDEATLVALSHKLGKKI
jgi:hypothetical protein